MLSFHSAWEFQIFSFYLKLFYLDFSIYTSWYWLSLPPWYERDYVCIFNFNIGEWQLLTCVILRGRFTLCETILLSKVFAFYKLSAKLWKRETDYNLEKTFERGRLITVGKNSRKKLWLQFRKVQTFKLGDWLQSSKVQSLKSKY